MPRGCIHDGFWYPCVGKPRVKAMLKTEWGKLFKSYGRTKA